MSVLSSVESKIAGLVEGTFGRLFRSQVRPVELARKLTREMDQHRTESLSRVYVPNEYVVWLSPSDRQRYEGVEGEVLDELAAHLLEHARREHLALASRPDVSFETDDGLSLGEFGIQTRLVRRADDDGGRVAQGDHGHTMVYSTSDRLSEPLQVARAERAGQALVVVSGKRLVVPAGGAVLGRSRDCDVVLADPDVSRRHAELRPQGASWTIADLGSTNGVTVNGRRVERPVALSSGDRLGLGNLDVVFEVR